MRRSALSYLACPACRAGLSLSPEGVIEDKDHVMAGTLACAGRGCRYAIVDGVPVLIPGGVEAEKTETARRFAEEWRRWRELRAYYERQFLGWIAPLARDDFRDRVVLEGGCGKGRHTAIAASFGAKAVVAVDLGAAAVVAFQNTRHLPNAHVVMGDLTRPPVPPASVDLAFSVGVIHHLPEPAAGVRALAACVRDGGRLGVWVYGRENNEWIVRFVDPARKALTARLPPALLRGLCAAPAAALWAAIKLLYRPRADGRGPRLPYGDYFASMHDFPFDELHVIVFDQLVTPVAHYLTGDEVRAWFADGFRDVTLRWHNRYSWTGVGTVAGREG